MPDLSGHTRHEVNRWDDPATRLAGTEGLLRRGLAPAGDKEHLVVFDHSRQIKAGTHGLLAGRRERAPVAPGARRSPSRASASSAGAPGVTSTPVSPPRMISSGPPQRVATTGFPAAMAWMVAREKPSETGTQYKQVEIAQVLSRIRAKAEKVNPVCTRPSACRSASSAASRLPLPSPAMTRCTAGKRAATSAKACSRVE